MHAAIPATFTHQLIDQDTLGRVHQRAALSAATLFCGAGLVVDDGGAAFDLSEFFLDIVQQIAVFHLDTIGQLGRGVFLWLIGHHHQFLHAFRRQGVGNLNHRMPLGALADLLPARHGHGIVIEHFVGDVHARRNRLANREQAAVEIRAIAEIGENMRVVDERLLADPRHAFAAHLREACSSAIHPQCHVVAANAGHGARAFGHFGGGVVWTARAEPRRAIGF